ncbi:hypothetical protein WDU94_004119 [Cyamophila willieti]
MVKVSKKLNTKNNVQQKEVTKYLKLQLDVLRVLGLFKLSRSEISHPYRFQLQKIYITFTYTLSTIVLTLGYLCAFLKASKNFSELFKSLVEIVCVSTILIDIILLNMKNTELLKLLDLMNSFDVTSRRSVFNDARKYERVVFVSYCVLIGFASACSFLLPFLPLSNEKCEFFQQIYGFKYPQNRLPTCLWIPYIDTSEPRWFTLFYTIEIYTAILWIGLAITDALFYPFILLHLSGQYKVLSSKLKILGRSSMCAASKWTLLKTLREKRMKRTQEIFEVKKCILFHRRLLSFRTLFDSVMARNIQFRVIIILIITSLSAYPITLLSQFDSEKNVQFIAEFILILSYYYFNCSMSENLDRCNSLIGHSVYQSNWYAMCPEARRMMVMFMRQTQRPQHIRTLGGMVALGNVNFMNTLKFLYNFIRFVRIMK